MTSPAVSVVLPTYNRASLLTRAVESVIAQTYADWELVVVDDGSTDDTATVAAIYASKLGVRFVYLRQENRGSSAARNRGIEASRGRFIAFLDSDDEFAPAKLARQLALFERRPELGLVYSDYSIVDTDGTALGSAFDLKFPIARTTRCQSVAPGEFTCLGSLFDTLVRGYFVSTITGMVRRDALGPTVRFSERHAYAEEWLFFLEVARATSAGFVDEPLSIHHYTPGSLARSDKRRNLLQMRELFMEMKRRFAGATRKQRAAIHGNLARVCRELGHAALKARPGKAARFFFEALRQKPDWTTFAELAGSMVHGAVHSRRIVAPPLPHGRGSEGLRAV